MKVKDIIAHRLYNQQLSHSSINSPSELVEYMVAMQAQEFAMAKWAISLRLANDLNEKAIEDSFNKGEILRTHLMRPTWHFVAPADIRWLLELTAPRVHRLNDYYYRKQSLDAKIFTKCHRVLKKAMEGGISMTRHEIEEVLTKNKIKTDGGRLISILMQAELERIICSGPRVGKQFTYALLEERVPPAIKMTREESLIQFFRRFVETRGPVTLNDFVYWSGLTMKDAKDAAEELPESFEKIVVDEMDYYWLPKDFPTASTASKSRSTFLMPDYDEYGMSYKNRDILWNHKAKDGDVDTSIFSHWLIIEGMAGGYWSRGIKKGKPVIDVKPIGKLSDGRTKNILKAKKRYTKFAVRETE